MKTFVILSLLIAILAINFIKCDEATDAINDRIRSHGVQIYQLVEAGEPALQQESSEEAATETSETTTNRHKRKHRHHKKKLENETGDEEASEEVDPEKQAKIDELMKQHKGLFNGDKIELPRVCKERLDQSQFIALLQKGRFFIEAWAEASGEENIVYNNLPYLDQDKFAAFYKAIGEGVTAEGSEVDPAKADKPDELLQAVSWGDRNRVETSWLEFWSRMCIGDEQPKASEWLGEPRTEAQKRVHEKAKADATANELEANKVKQSIAAGETLPPEEEATGDQVQGQAIPQLQGKMPQVQRKMRKSKIHHKKSSQKFPHH